MATIGLSELPAALRTVLEQGEALDVTDQGAVVARIVPVAPTRRCDLGWRLTSTPSMSSRPRWARLGRVT